MDIAQVWCVLLCDKVSFRMHWPSYADLRVNGTSLFDAYISFVYSWILVIQLGRMFSTKLFKLMPASAVVDSCL